jgi:hypothetical protein
VDKGRAVALVCAAAATLLLAFAAAGVARAEPRMAACDVEGLWTGQFVGTMSGTAPVAFRISNQAPPAPEDDDGSEDFARAAELATGLGNAGEGDKYHFRWTTVISLAEAQGHGFLFIMPDGLSATFVVAGHGFHPAFGTFTLTGGGDVVCFAGEGIAADAMMVHVRYSNDMTEEGAVPAMPRCLEDICEVPGL